VTSALLFAATAKKSSSSSLIFIVILVVMAGFLFLSTRKRKAASQQLQTGLKVGSKIMTTAGLFATVVAVEDDGVILEVAPGVHSKYARQAISRVLDAPDGAEPLDDDDAGDSSIDLNKEPPNNS
jgi:preprotein translocase subunit YajC